jgi:cytochrome c2
MRSSIDHKKSKNKRMKIKLPIFWLIGLTFSSVNVSADPPSEGKTIFTSRCAACHSVNKTLTGPALAGVDQRRTIDWIINFVHSSQTVIKSGDKDAVALYEKFNHIPMPDHPDLKDDDIKNIVEYIKSEAKPVEEEKAPFARPGKKKPNYTPLSITNDWHYFVSYFGAVFILIGTLLFAVHVRTLKGD